MQKTLDLLIENEIDYKIRDEKIIVNILKLSDITNFVFDCEIHVENIITLTNCRNIVFNTLSVGDKFEGICCENSQDVTFNDVKQNNSISLTIKVCKNIYADKLKTLELLIIEKSVNVSFDLLEHIDTTSVLVDRSKNINLRNLKIIEVNLSITYTKHINLEKLVVVKGIVNVIKADINKINVIDKERKIIVFKTDSYYLNNIIMSDNILILYIENMGNTMISLDRKTFVFVIKGKYHSIRPNLKLAIKNLNSRIEHEITQLYLIKNKWKNI